LLEHVVDQTEAAERAAKITVCERSLRVFTECSNSLILRVCREREKLIREIERNLTVRTSGSSRLLEVTYESPDPKGAADFANTLVSQFIELSQEERWKAAQGTARMADQPP